MASSCALVSWLDNRFDCAIGRAMLDQRFDKVDQRCRLEEHKPARVEVIRQRAKRLRAQSYLATAFPLRRRVEGGCAQTNGLVDAAHAIDGDLLDEQFFFNELVAHVGGFGFSCRFHWLQFHCVP